MPTYGAVDEATDALLHSAGLVNAEACHDMEGFAARDPRDIKDEGLDTLLTEYEAYLLSATSVVVTACAAVLGTVWFVISPEDTMLGYALINAVDTASSAVLVWRFDAPARVTKASIAEGGARERRSIVALAISLVLIGLSLTALGAYALLTGEKVDGSSLTTPLVLLATMVVSVVFGVAKMFVARATRSFALALDGGLSFASATLAAGSYAATVFKVSAVDPAVGLVVGVVLVVGGWTVLAPRLEQ